MPGTVTAHTGRFLADHHIRCPKCGCIEDLLTNPEEGMRPRPLDCNFVRSWFTVGRHCVDCFKCHFHMHVEVTKRGPNFRFWSETLHPGAPDLPHPEAR